MLEDYEKDAIKRIIEDNYGFITGSINSPQAVHITEEEYNDYQILRHILMEFYNLK